MPARKKIQDLAQKKGAPARCPACRELVKGLTVPINPFLGGVCWCSQCKTVFVWAFVDKGVTHMVGIPMDGP